MTPSTTELSPLVDLIVSDDPATWDRPLADAAAELDDDALLAACDQLDAFWQDCDNLYQRVRALFFLYALHRFVLPERGLCPDFHPVPQGPMERVYSRRFEFAIRELLALAEVRRSDTYASCLASAYHGLALQNLADQVRRCVRNVPGNRWMFRTGHPADLPLQVRRELIRRDESGARPCLVERTPVRMDLSHSGWSDIFFLAMDRPEFARVLNVSIDLCVRGDGREPRPPVEAWFRVIDEPVVRLVSVDLEAEARIDNLPEIFDFGRDYLGLLKAALVASGIIPAGLEGSGADLREVLEPMLGRGRGFELVSCVYNIPKGSRLAVSTNLLAALVGVCMRATGQIGALEGGLEPAERSTIAARAILGEWLGGSGGGWQDSGGVWPGIKLIEGCLAGPGDSEHGVSRGRLLPRHTVFGDAEIPPSARAALQQSLILVHGGLAQNVGPILEMVTERYLLRSADEWAARAEALELNRGILEALKAGDIRRVGELTTRNFFGPIKTIIPWASNAFSEALIDEVKQALGDAFWGFWMLGGMSGGGMGFIVDPAAQAAAKDRIAAILGRLKAAHERALPFAIDPVIYDFRINDRGSFAEFGALDLPDDYYRLRLPLLLRKPPAERLPHEAGDLAAVRRRLTAAAGAAGEAGWIASLLSGDDGSGSGNGTDSAVLDRLLAENGFDPPSHEKLREQLLAGEVGLAQNRLHPRTRIEDPAAADLEAAAGEAALRARGEAALAAGEAAVVTLAAGAGSRWTQGAGVVKALHPFAPFAGAYRNFIEVHLAKTRRTGGQAGTPPPHVFTTSYLTDGPIRDWLDGWQGPREGVHLSRGSAVGLRLVPTLRDLRFAWEETPQPRLDAQAQKVRDSVRAALKRWAAGAGEGADYRDNLPGQCLHPVGHWYEVPGLLLNGTLAALLEERPQLRTLLLHNIDTLGATLDPELLGRHLASGNTLSFELISRRFDDVGGGLARVDGKLRLVEGMALPREEDEHLLRYYNTLTTWIDIDALLAAFGLDRGQLGDAAAVRAAVRAFATKLPAYITLKEVKKRWGRGQEDVFPVLQFERLWGDMSAVDGVACGYFHVPRLRGQQLKDPAQLDGWLRDGSHDYVGKLCRFPT